RDVDDADMPGLHRERLSAAQPAPEEVGGEHHEDEKLQRVAQAAGGGVLAAADEEEQPGGEETDREQQDRLVDHGSEPPQEPGRARRCATSYGDAPERCLRVPAARAAGIRPTAGAVCRAAPAAP